METINQRIAQLLDTLGMTKTSFAESLNVSQQYISKLIRTGMPSNLLIDNICHKYNVNENALRTGEGWPEHMFNEFPEEDEIAQLVYDLLTDKENPFFQIIVATLKTYQQLTPENQDVFRIYCNNILENLPSKKDA